MRQLHNSHMTKSIRQNMRISPRQAKSPTLQSMTIRSFYLILSRAICRSKTKCSNRKSTASTIKSWPTISRPKSKQLWGAWRSEKNCKISKEARLIISMTRTWTTLKLTREIKCCSWTVSREWPILRYCQCLVSSSPTLASLPTYSSSWSSFWKTRPRSTCSRIRPLVKRLRSFSSVTPSTCSSAYSRAIFSWDLGGERSSWLASWLASLLCSQSLSWEKRSTPKSSFSPLSSWWLQLWPKTHHSSQTTSSQARSVKRTRCRVF